MMQNYERAYALNLGLKEINFDEYASRYQANRMINPLFPDLERFINILKRGPNNIALYYYFQKSQNAALLGEEGIKKDWSLYINIYYTSPLLIHSTFKNAVEQHIKFGQKEAALEFLRILKNLRPNFRHQYEKLEAEAQRIS